MKKVLSVFLLILMLSFTGCNTESDIVDIGSEPNNSATENAMPVDVEGNDLGYICNLKSKKFHLPTCYTLPNAENSEYILSREKAVDNGYIPCQNCNP